MVIEKPPDRITLTVDFAGNEHPVVRANGFQTERSPVQCLMVQPAQRQSVYDLVRAAGGHPHDMGRLQTDKVIAEPDIEVANGATVFVFAEHMSAESWVTPSFRRLSNFPSVRNTSGSADLIVQRLWEMCVQETLCSVSCNIQVTMQ